MDGMWWLRGELSRCSGFWLGHLGRVWGQRARGEGAAQKEGATSRCWVGDRVSFVDVDLEVAFKSSKREPHRFVSALLLANSLSSLDRVSSWGSLCVWAPSVLSAYATWSPALRTEHPVGPTAPLV